MWNGVTGEKIQSFDNVSDVEFSPVGSRFLTISSEISVWHSGAEVALFSGHTDVVREATFHKDGNLVITSSNDGTTRLWEAQTGREILQMQFGGDASNLRTQSLFGPGGEFVVTTYVGYGNVGAGVAIWETESGEIISQNRFYAPSCFDVNKQTNSLLCSVSGASLDILQPDTLTIEFSLEGTNQGTFSPNGDRIVTFGGDKVELWDTLSGHPLLEITNHNFASFAPNNQSIVVESTDGTISIRDIETGDTLVQLQGNDVGTKPVFSPDGNKLMTRNGNDLYIWNVDTGKRVTILQGHTDRINDVQFSSDSKLIVTASADNTARVWDAATGDLMSILRGHVRQVNSATFSPDNRHILTASDDGTARLYYVLLEDVITLAQQLKAQAKQAAVSGLVD